MALFLPDNWVCPSIPCPIPFLFFLICRDINGMPKQTREPALSTGLPLVSCPAATKTPGTMPGSVALAPAPMQALLLIVKSTVRHGTNKAPITRPGIMASHAGGERHKRLDSRNEGRELKP